MTETNSMCRPTWATSGDAISNIQALDQNVFIVIVSKAADKSSATRLKGHLDH